MKSRVEYKGGMAFKGEVDGFSITMDTREDLAGNNSGPMPKGLLLNALGGCTGMEVVTMLKGMEADPGNLTIDIESDSAEQDPRVFTRLLLTYRFSGGSVTREQAERAISLSHETYCSISAMLAKSCPVDYEIEIN